jgi:hypothetical protein
MVANDRSNRRRARRWNVMWPATLAHDDREYPCVILDLSESGMKIELLRGPFVKAPDQLRHDRLGTLAVRMAWVRGRLAGFRFEAAPGEIARLLKPLVPGFDRRDQAIKLPETRRTPRASFGRKTGTPSPAAAPAEEADQDTPPDSGSRLSKAA